MSDIHIRNLRYRKEYRAAFEDLYRQLDVLRPDLIINTGDTVHSKLSVSPELFDDVATHMMRMSEFAPYWLILGNHDLNLKNRNRTDAISPVVRAISGNTKNEVVLLPPGLTSGNVPGFDFWHFDIRDDDINDSIVDESHINIGLYHGAVAGCVGELGFQMQDGTPLSKFDRMDFVLMGDIHKRQSFRAGRMQYPGSLIQQNYGETRTKGFLVWDIVSADEFDVTFQVIEAPGRFYTINALDWLGQDIPHGSRIRAVVPNDMTPSQRWDVEQRIRTEFKPAEFICTDSSAVKERDAQSVAISVGDRASLMEEWFDEHEIAKQTRDEIVALMGFYVDDDERNDSINGTSWQMSALGWSNMMNFGEDNLIDVGRLSGAVGIFAPNGSGKSSVFDIMLQALFDKVSKEVPRNIDLINDNRTVGKMIVEFTSDERSHTIERTIERLEYGQRKLKETKQWGKTSLDFSIDGQSMNGTTRPETERSIRRVVGSFDDFILTTMLTQNPIIGLPGGGDIISCKETDRRKILFRFLDLDFYEKMAQRVKDDLKELTLRMAECRRDKGQLGRDVNAELAGSRQRLLEERSSLNALESELERLRATIIQSDDGTTLTLASRQEKLSRELLRLRDEAAKVSQSVLESKNKLSILSDERSSADRSSVARAEINGSIDSARSWLIASRAKLTKLSGELARGRVSLKVLDAVPCESKFPTCKFIADAISFKNDEMKIVAEKEQLENSTSSAEISLETLLEQETRLSKLEKIDTTIIEARAAFDVTRSRLEALERLMSSCEEELTGISEQLNPASAARLLELRTTERELLRAIQSSRSNVEKHVAECAVLDAESMRQETVLRELTDMGSQMTSRELLLEMLGKNGLPYKILGRALPLINEQIAKVLSGVVKFSVFFADDSETQNISLYIRYNDYKSRPLSLGGGAEKFIASLAIRIALLTVSTLPKNDMLIIDEGFGKLDTEHLEAFQRMLEKLKNYFRVVFMISHVDFMKDIVDHSIEIVSKGGCASVEVN